MKLRVARCQRCGLLHNTAQVKPIWSRWSQCSWGPLDSLLTGCSSLLSGKTCVLGKERLLISRGGLLYINLDPSNYISILGAVGFLLWLVRPSIIDCWAPWATPIARFGVKFGPLTKPQTRSWPGAVKSTYSSLPSEVACFLGTKRLLISRGRLLQILIWTRGTMFPCGAVLPSPA